MSRPSAPPGDSPGERVVASVRGARAERPGGPDGRPGADGRDGPPSRAPRRCHRRETAVDRPAASRGGHPGALSDGRLASGGGGGVRRTRSHGAAVRLG